VRKREQGFRPFRVRSNEVGARLCRLARCRLTRGMPVGVKWDGYGSGQVTTTPQLEPDTAEMSYFAVQLASKGSRK
jgi:hypothetical protein